MGNSDHSVIAVIGYLGAQHTGVRAASEVVPGKDYLSAMKGEYQVKQILRCIQRAAPKKRWMES